MTRVKGGPFETTILVLLFAVAASGQLTIHLVPHSHCDLGYKKTIDGYYQSEVRVILSSLATNLANHSDRRFIWAEAYWLHTWMLDKRVPSSLKSNMQRLVASGMVEVVDGGWSMHDDAITLVDQQLQNLRHGHAALLEHFGPDALPRHGWHIDPFGPTVMDATLYAFGGYEGVVLNRMNSAIKGRLQQVCPGHLARVLLSAELSDHNPAAAR
ncbi:hypothetical protein CYMTET_45492 [Cymbomonas tetramitiformis]|uniref:Glycoside hydrolase family 38 N-terminal domain-containing protein n=1 Tax=Cymbomonas tetramitiformis TaxID=36881 RepID=A0AAE0C065_9CHLO|nr:hypothetical protein CYMTET_45492 [Cymbomonas tetramitiformis]